MASEKIAFDPGCICSLYLGGVSYTSDINCQKKLDGIYTFCCSYLVSNCLMEAVKKPNFMSYG
jgi:hypothetical protein